MSFVFKKKVLSSILAATMAAGFAASQNAAAIHLTEDHVGQVLLAPLYLAHDKLGVGYNTEVTIVNTRTDVAVKAKITIRSAAHSQEALDFICYLTPADVCKFQIRQPDGSVMVNGKDMPYIWSDDDSIKAEDTNPPKFASQVQGGLKQALTDAKVLAVDPNDTVKMGHFEVIGVYAAEGVVQTAPVWGGIQQAQVPVTVRREMPKMDVARIFDTPRTQVTSALMAGTLGAVEFPRFLDNMNVPERANMATGRMVAGVCRTSPANNAAATTPCNPFTQTVDNANVRSTDPRVVRLTGTARILPKDGSDRMAYKIPALAGEIWDQVDPSYSIWENGIIDPMTGDVVPQGVDGGILGALRWTTPQPPAVAGIGTGYGFDGRVIASPTYDQMVAAETLLGVEMGSGGLHNILEIEHALATSSVKNEYEDDGYRFTNGQSTPGDKRTQLVITFPTKYMHRGHDVCNTYLQHQVATGRMAKETAYKTYTVPFTMEGKVRYGLAVYDNQEHSQAVTKSIVFSPAPLISTLELPSEVNYFVPTWPTTTVGQNNYESGWFELSFNQQTQSTHYSPGVGCDYAGVPALSMSHNHQIINGMIANSWLTPNAHSQELVNRQYNWKAQGNDY